MLAELAFAHAHRSGWVLVVRQVVAHVSRL